MGLDDVLVATHLIDTHEQVLLDDAPPVPVLLDVGGVVLEHILLGLGQGSGVNGGAGVLFFSPSFISSTIYFASSNPFKILSTSF